MMRTTLTLDPDVAAALLRVRTRDHLSLKAAVNEALRRGLSELEEPPARPERYSTPSRSLGGCRLGGLDDITEGLAISEGEDFK